VSVGTNTLFTNVNGETTINRVQFAVSLLLTINPNIAERQEIAAEIALRGPTPKAIPSRPAWHGLPSSGLDLGYCYFFSFVGIAGIV
jgi:hypothetical protein